MTLFALGRHLVFAAGIALISALVVRAMITARVMDLPKARSSHAVPTPRGGGVGIVVGFLLGVSVLYGFASFARIGDPYFRGVILASIAIAVVGFIDDLRDWPFSVKLGTQTAAALVAVGSGLYVSVFRLPVIGAVSIGPVAGAAVTVGWIVLATNAMNFIDGLNGLAAGTALVAAGFLAVIAALQGGWFVYFAALLLAAGILGFMPYNFPRARIFMGDVGSQFCGFVLAVLGVAANRFERVEMSFLLVPMLLSGVLYDVVFTLVRRALAGERITEAHRGHLYQVAQRSGIDARIVAMAHWGFAGLGGIVCFGFLAVPSGAKAWLPAVLLLPQVAWTFYVRALARRAGLGRW